LFESQTVTSLWLIFSGAVVHWEFAISKSQATTL